MIVEFVDQWGSLLSHMIVHIGVKFHSCNWCGKCFIHKGNLEAHVTTHTGEKDHLCDRCGKSFSHRCSLIIYQSEILVVRI